MIFKQVLFNDFESMLIQDLFFWVGGAQQSGEGKISWKGLVSSVQQRKLCTVKKDVKISQN